MCYIKSIYLTVLCFYFALNLISVHSQNTSMIIPLNKTVTYRNREMYGEFLILNSSSVLTFKYENVAKDIEFIIFQVHSHLYNVTLYKNIFKGKPAVSGTNIGMYSQTVKFDTFYIHNPNEKNLSLYVSVQGYQNKDPIPGGCNMEFSVPIAPYLKNVYNNDYITVGAGAPKLYNYTCNVPKPMVEITFYRLYLYEMDFETDTYFRAIRNMITLDKIEQHGTKIPETGTIMMKRMLSAYRGTGAVYVIVAKRNNSMTDDVSYSVYVPSVTYACAPQVDGDCDLLVTTLSRVACASLIFLGLFICFLGHWYFKTHIFLLAMMSGFLLTYISMLLLADLSENAQVAASLISGIFFGAIVLTFWWFYGIPVVAIVFTTLNLGFLLSSIIYFAGGLQTLVVDLNFWSIFLIIMFLTPIIPLSTTYMTNLACCAIIGSYAVIYPIDFYLGSSFKYIIINVIRRATVYKFNEAVTTPPFFWNEFMLIMVWIALAFLGLMYQTLQNRGRPPFPPPPRTLTVWVPDTPIYGALDSQNSRPGTMGRETRSNQPNRSRNNERTRLLPNP